MSSVFSDLEVITDAAAGSCDGTADGGPAAGEGPGPAWRDGLELCLETEDDRATGPGEGSLCPGD